MAFTVRSAKPLWSASRRSGGRRGQLFIITGGFHRSIHLVGGALRELLDSVCSCSTPPRVLSCHLVPGSLRRSRPPRYGLGQLRNIAGTVLFEASACRFATSHPDVDVTVRCGNSDELSEALSTGALDLAVLFEEVVRPDSEVLTADPTVWATSKIYCMHEQDPVPVAVYELDCWCRDWALKSSKDMSPRLR